MVLSDHTMKNPKLYAIVHRDRDQIEFEIPVVQSDQMLTHSILQYIHHLDLENTT